MEAAPDAPLGTLQRILTPDDDLAWGEAPQEPGLFITRDDHAAGAVVYCGQHVDELLNGHNVQSYPFSRLLQGTSFPLRNAPIWLPASGHNCAPHSPLFT